MEENLCSAMQGWQCPICKRVYSPFTQMCFYCGNEEVKTVTSFNTGDVVKINSSDFRNQTTI